MAHLSSSRSSNLVLKTKAFIGNQIDLIFMTGIVILSLLLRVIYLDSMEFKHDEAFNLMKAGELVALKGLPLRSAVSSTGIPEPPAFMYLLSIPLVINDDPVFVAAFIAMLNILGLVLCYLLVRRYISPIAAIIASSFYAVSPWQVLFSRKIWTQNLLPPIVLLFLFQLFEAVFHRRPRLIILALVFLSLSVQLHLSAIFLGPFMLFFVVWQRRNINFKYLGIGILLALLLLTPYIADLCMSDFEALRALIELTKTSFALNYRGIMLPLKLITTSGFEYSLGGSYEDFNQFALRLSVLDCSMMLLCGMGLAMAIYSTSPAQRALALYTLTGLGFFLFLPRKLYPHYYNALLPVLFILCAFPVALLLTQFNKLFRCSVLLGLAALLIYQFTFTISLLGFINRSDCIYGDYGPPYHARLEHMNEAIENLLASGESLDLDTVHENSRYCDKWDLLATQYVLERLGYTNH